MPKIIKTCLRCGKEFGVHPSNASRYPCDYCSPECAHPPRTLTCLACDNTFMDAPSREHRLPFCDLECKTSPEGVAARFWANVDMSGECWLWQGHRNEKGYGRFKFGGINTMAHRVAYILTNPEFDNVLQVLHECDNPPCCRPDHLFHGTNDDNVADKVSKKRQARTINEEDAIEIRRAYANGENLMRELANKFGIGVTQVHRIVREKRWTHLPKSSN